MHLPPFLLDHWIAGHEFADPPIAFNLASSTGPRWTVAELLALGDDPPDLQRIVLSYAPPKGSAALREAVAAYCGADPEWVVMTTGASEALSIFLCLAERPGGNIVIPAPSYPAYAAMARMWRLDVRFYALSAASGFAQSADAVLEAVTPETCAVIVNTPHNPTGSVMPRAEITRLAAALAARDVPVIVDEVYHPLYFTTPLPSAAGIENVAVIGDLSKAMSLPGLRTGWIIERDAQRCARLIDARSYGTISASPLVEVLATHALRVHPAITTRLHHAATRNLETLQTLIASSDGRLAWHRPEGGTTSFPWFTDRRDSRAFCERLAAQGVLVAPGDCFGMPEYMRIGFAQLETGFDSAAARIAAALSQ